MARIGLDARMAGPVPSGLGTYAANLARTLAGLDRANTYVVIRRPECRSPMASNVEDVALPGELDRPGNLLRGRDIARLRLDLYHSLHHFLPLALRVPRVVITLHDLIWIDHAALSRPDRIGGVANHLFARATMGRALRRADRIIAVSAYSAARAVEYYKLDPARVHVVHHGVDHERFRGDPMPASPPFFLCLGNTRPYKNIPTALKAFAACARRHETVTLVVAGRGDSVGALRPLARRLGIDSRVRFVGPLDAADVLTLLHGAIALVFPSLVEGFGLPVLEAMAAGCPVIASRSPTVVEIAGGAAMFCDAASVDEFSAAMTTVLHDASLQDDLRARGRERARYFSWQRCASETLAVYQQLL